MGNRLSPSSFSKVSRLQEIARTIQGLRQDQTILDRSQFYETVLALLADIVLEIAKMWPEAESTSQDSPFDATSTSIRFRDLHLQLKIWHGDLIDSKTSFGSWQNDVDFRQSALCQAVLYHLNGIRELVVVFIRDVADIVGNCLDKEFVSRPRFLAICATLTCGVEVEIKSQH